MDIDTLAKATQAVRCYLYDMCSCGRCVYYRPDEGCVSPRWACHLRDVHDRAFDLARAVLEVVGVIPSKQEQTLFWQALEQYIARLRTIPQVEGLRIWQDGRNIYIYILLRNEHYEDDVMEKLANPEMELTNTARGLQLDFQYIPVLIVPEETIIPPEAKLVYWADDEVSLTKTREE